MQLFYCLDKLTVAYYTLFARLQNSVYSSKISSDNLERTNLISNEKVSGLEYLRNADNYICVKF